MGALQAEVHQVRDSFVHLVSQESEVSGEVLGLIEGGGICLANSFSTVDEVDRWLHHIFHQLFPGHRCDLGCIRMPNAEFVADHDVLERLAGLDSPLPR